MAEGIDPNLLSAGMAAFNPNVGAPMPGSYAAPAASMNGPAGAGAGLPGLPSVRPGMTLDQLAAGDQYLQDLAARQQEADKSYQAMQGQAQRQNKFAHSTLGTIVNGVGGVLGLPLRLLEGVAGNGNIAGAVDAAIHPGRTADVTYQSQLAQIANARTALAKQMQAERGSRMTELGKLLSDSRTDMAAGLSKVAELGINALHGNTPQDQQAVWQAGIAAMANEDPTIAQLGLDRVPFSPALVAQLVGRTGNKDIAERWDKTYAPDIIQAPQNGAAVARSKLPGQANTVVYQGANIPANGAGWFSGGDLPPPVSHTPAVQPQAGGAMDFGPRPKGMTDQQLYQRAAEAIQNGEDQRAVLAKLHAWIPSLQGK